MVPWHGVHLGTFSAYYFEQKLYGELRSFLEDEL